MTRKGNGEYFRLLKTTLKYLGIGVLSLIAFTVLFILLAPQFGAAPMGESLERIHHSHHHNGKVFENLLPTVMSTQTSDGYNYSMLDFFFPQKNKNPQSPLPSKKLTYLEENSFAWLGHSTILMKLHGVTIMTDPVFHRASPLPIFGAPFALENPTLIKDLPPVDIVVISHDHYDHLEHKAMKKLREEVKYFVVPLGVRAHLEHWGVPSNNIVELDWYESTTIEGIAFTSTPARHFSGRSVNDKDRTLWSSWAIKSDSHNVFFSGDSGYSDEFSNIGSTYGPFDIAFIDSGAYDESWSQIHMMPEESVQASIDLQAEVMVPVMWSKFDLAFHTWDDPIIRATAAGSKLGAVVATPIIGEAFTLDDIPQSRWWEE